MADGATKATIIVAIIGAVSAVTVALIQVGGTPQAQKPGEAEAGTVPDTMVENVVDPTPTPSPTPAAAPQLTHPLQVANLCAGVASFMLYYQDEEGWTSHEGARWTIQSGATNTLTHDGASLDIVEGDVYVRGELDGSTIWFGNYMVAIGDQKLGFQKATLVPLDNGGYQINLTCPDS